MTSDIHPHWKSTDPHQGGDRPACPPEAGGRIGESGGGAPRRADDDAREGGVHRVPIVQSDDDPSEPARPYRTTFGRARPDGRSGGRPGRAGREQPGRRERYRWKMVLPFGAASMLLLFVFVGGVSFFRASLLETTEESVEPAPSPPAPHRSEATGAGSPLAPRSPALSEKGLGEVGSPATVPPVLNLGQASVAPPATVWPALLRVNRYTVGSHAYRQAGGLIPEFPPTRQLPVHVVRETREKLHSSAPPGQRPPARRQPETGPAMWVLGVMSLGVLPLFLRRRV